MGCQLSAGSLGPCTSGWHISQLSEPSGRPVGGSPHHVRAPARYKAVCVCLQGATRDAARCFLVWGGLQGRSSSLFLMVAFWGNYDAGGLCPCSVPWVPRQGFPRDPQKAVASAAQGPAFRIRAPSLEKNVSVAQGRNMEKGTRLWSCEQRPLSGHWPLALWCSRHTRGCVCVVCPP